MRIIIDENIPYPLLRRLSHHTATSVQKEGWAGIKNGKLLELIDSRFDVFILGDKNLRYQQNLSTRRIAIVELYTNRWPLIEPLIPQIINAIESAAAGSYVLVEP